MAFKDVASKFLSRKFILSAVAFVTVQVLPNLSAGTQARLSALVAVGYAVAQGFVDGLDVYSANKSGTKTPV